MDNTAEEDPLLSIPSSSGGKSLPSSASTSSMSMSVESEDNNPLLRSSNNLSGAEALRPTKAVAEDAEDDDEVRKHLHRTKIDLFGWKRGVWVSHSRLLCLVMVLDWMTLSVQVSKVSFPSYFTSGSKRRTSTRRK